METPEIKFHGFIQQEKMSDYVRGINSPILSGVRLPSADWTPYITSNDPQSDPFMDTMACTSFSATHVVELQMNLIISQGGFLPYQLNWLKSNGYINADGKVELSERWVAKVSGTTHGGNTFQAVWDAIRIFGIAPLSDWKFTPDMKWDDFYAPIPSSLYPKAKALLEIINVVYDFVPTAGGIGYDMMSKLLQVAPMQIAIPIPSYHAVTLYKSVQSGISIYDHYEPYQYSASYAYPIGYMLQAQVTAISANPFPRTLRMGMSGSDVARMQSVIGVKADGKFGDLTFRALSKFQLLNGLMPDGVAGQKTIAKLGAILNAPMNGTPQKIRAWCEAIKDREGWITPSDKNHQYPKGTPSYQNNNPGNLEFNHQPGAVQNGRWAKFDTYEDGYGALERLLMHACQGASGNYKPDMTLYEFYQGIPMPNRYGKIVYGYSPESDGNDSNGYAEFVAKRVGVSPQAQIRDLLT